MTREEAITKYIVPAIEKTWNDKRCKEILEALEQEPCEDNNANQHNSNALNDVGQHTNALEGDAISRQATITAIKDYFHDEYYQRTSIQDCRDDFIEDVLTKLSPVNPQKMGHWIKTPKAVMGEGYMWYCDKCEYEVYQDSSRPYPSEKYCPNCGARNFGTRMVDPQESEGLDADSD